MKRFLRTIVVAPYRLVLRLWWPLLQRMKHSTIPRRVLICVVNDLMAAHVAVVVDLFRSDSQIKCYVTSPSGTRTADTSLSAISNRLRVPAVNYALSRFKWWDLIIFAEHRGVDQFHPATRKLMIQHGYDSGKLFDGEDIRYGRRSMYRADNGEPRYDKIFECSSATAQTAVREDSRLANRIAVVGDLGADRMLAMTQQRSELRGAAGYAENDFVVMLMGTWKCDSLMESAGQELMGEAVRLRNSFRFIFSTHPLHWRGDYARQHPWGKFLSDHEQLGVAVLRPDDDWERAAIIADMAIADHSSVGVKFALLNKPLLFLKRREGLVAPGTFGARLYDALPHVCSAAALESAIENARRSYPFERLAQIADEINAYPGKAAQRVREEIYQLLDLQVT
jgi:hypothetical protein